MSKPKRRRRFALPPQSKKEQAGELKGIWNAVAEHSGAKRRKTATPMALN